MARKKKPEEHENHERWLVSYADFITLLFAFFVVMYSISSVNEGKYRVLSNSLITAFGTPVRSMQPIQVGNLVRSNEKTIDNLKTPPSAVMKHPEMKGLPQDQGEGSAGGELTDSASAAETESESAVEGTEKLTAMAAGISEALQGFIDEELVTVSQDQAGVRVEVNSHVLFASGSSLLSDDALPVLRDIAEVLEGSTNEIHVEGFTDSRPINTMIYPSNWELSAARSATVVRLFAGYRIEPGRMVSVGYGEHRPIADNATAEGRAKNRRVVVVVLAKTRSTTPVPEVEQYRSMDPDVPIESPGLDDVPMQEVLTSAAG